MSRAQHTDEVIQKALQGALNIRNNVLVDKNLVDAFTSRLMDAGVQLDELDLLFEEADETIHGDDCIDRLYAPDQDDSDIC
jgi:hypothetical protein